MSGAFRSRLARGERLVGLFVKQTGHEAVEVLGQGGFDCLVLDAEHAPFGRESLGLALLAARAAGVPALVRVPDAGLAGLQQAVALGAAGVIVPHLADAATAAACAGFLRGLAAERALAGQGRATAYGAAGEDGDAAAFGRTLVFVAQVDEPSGVEAVEEIAAVPGLDALFIGRWGLTLRLTALQGAPADPVPAMRRICAAARAAKLALGLFLPDARQAGAWLAEGASFFVAGTDHALLLEAARARAAAFRTALNDASHGGTA